MNPTQAQASDREIGASCSRPAPETLAPIQSARLGAGRRAQRGVTVGSVARIAAAAAVMAVAIDPTAARTSAGSAAWRESAPQVGDRREAGAGEGDDEDPAEHAPER